jgi:hypothetical protein
LWQADVLQLTGSPTAPFEGVVVEARMDKGLGSVVTAIVRDGRLVPGDYVVAGNSWGKVRLLLNDQNQRIAEATAAMPVQVMHAPRCDPCLSYPVLLYSVTVSPRHYYLFTTTDSYSYFYFYFYFYFYVNTDIDNEQD